MPAVFELDHTQRLLRTRGWDLVTADDLYALARRIRRLFDEGVVDATWRELVDFRAVTRTDYVPAEAVRNLAHHNPWPHTARRVIVAPELVVFGMSRMYQILSSPVDDAVSVVRTEEEALELLDLRTNLA